MVRVMALGRRVRCGGSFSACGGIGRTLAGLARVSSCAEDCGQQRGYVSRTRIPEESILPAYDDHALAADLAERAGQLLLALRAKGGDPGALRNAGDRQSHEFLMEELAKARPDDAVLSEEGLDDKARLSADR